MESEKIKSLPKTEWFEKVKDNWQLDDFLLNRIQVRLEKIGVLDIGMEEIESVALQLLELGYCK